MLHTLNGFEISLNEEQILHRICKNFLINKTTLIDLLKIYIYRDSCELMFFNTYIFPFIEKAKSLFNCNTRMEKALQRLAEAKMTSKSGSSNISSTNESTNDTMKKVNISIIDTPPTTPTVEKNYLSTAFKGIPKALLEKVELYILFSSFL